MKKLCLFDCDGTLVDSQHAIVAAMTTALTSQGVPAPDPREVRRVVGLSLYDAIARLLPDADDALCRRLADGYVGAVEACRYDGINAEPLYPGAREAIAALDRGGWLLGMATGKSHRSAVRTLLLHGLSDSFVTIQTPEQSAGKPAPDMIFRALADTGAEVSRTVMIGDTIFDMAMAKRAGAYAVGVGWGYHQQDELWASGADVVVESFSELPGVLDDLLAPRG